MTDSPRLEEVFAAVLAEHVIDFFGCSCGVETGSCGDDQRAHVAERLAARFEQVGWQPAQGSRHLYYSRPDTIVDDDGVEHKVDCEWVPVFRLLGGDQ